MKPAKHLIRRAFNQAAATYDAAAAVQRQACDLLARHLHHDQAPQSLLDAGCGTGYGLRLLQQRYPTATAIGLDLAPAMLQRAQPFPGIAGDLEHLPLADACIDLYWSSLTVQWCDLGRVLSEAARVLRPDGQILLSTLGAATFNELRSAFASSDRHRHTLEFLPAHTIAPLAEAAGLRAAHIEQTHLVTYHTDLKALLRSVKAIGANQLGAGRRTGLMSRAAFARAEAAYESLRQPDGLPLTYDLLCLHATR